MSAITKEALYQHIEILSSDLFAGRAPGSPGEQLTLNYLKEQCQKLGLEPAAQNGSYFEEVKVLGRTAHPQLSFTFQNQTRQLRFLDDFVARSTTSDALYSQEAGEMVFVGYGIQAPEYNFDSYQGLNVSGKTLVMLIGDPSEDPQYFRGAARTFYGRWTYKCQIAHKLGAKALLIIHDSQQAGYAFDVVRASWGGENFDLAEDFAKAEVEGWLSEAQGRELLSREGLDLDTLKRKANHPDFKAIPLKTRVNFHIETEKREFTSANVLAKITGSDDELKDEAIIYSAHWDHFGSTTVDGITQTYSGALDNASGIATLLEIAKAFKSQARANKRSLLFLFTTLEESGLLGAKHYAKAPALPLNKTLAIINFDIMNVWGATREIVSIARGHSSLDEILALCAAKQERVVVDDPEQDKGYFYRSDHLEFLTRGIPALFFLHPGSAYIGQAPDYGLTKRQAYLANDYHKFSDKIKEDWDLTGTVQDAQLLYEVGKVILDARDKPTWYKHSEFCPKA